MSHEPLSLSDPVIFVRDDLQPIPKARNAISFGCGPFNKDVLSTADSEELIGNLWALSLQVDRKSALLRPITSC